YVLATPRCVHVRSPVGEILPDRTINSRRKHVSKTWTNHEWTNRLFAITDFLARGTDAIRFGSTPEAEVVISAKPITLSAQVGINEASLDMAEPAEEEVASGYDHADYADDPDDDDE